MSAAPKHSPANVSRLFDQKQTGELPSPFNRAQVEGLAHDLEKIERTMMSASAEDRDAAILHVIATWTARAARLYASNLDDQVREDFERHLNNFVGVMQEFKIELTTLEARLRRLESE